MFFLSIGFFWFGFQFGYLLPVMMVCMSVLLQAPAITQILFYSVSVAHVYFYFCQSLLQVVTTISFTVGMLTSVQRKHIFGLLFVKEIRFVFTVVRFCFNNATREKKVSGLLSNTKSMHCVFAVCLFLSGESFLGTASFQ